MVELKGGRIAESKEYEEEPDGQEIQLPDLALRHLPTRSESISVEEPSQSVGVGGGGVSPAAARTKEQFLLLLSV